MFKLRLGRDPYSGEASSSWGTHRHRPALLATDATAYGALLLRLVLAALFLAHLYRKLFITGMHAWWTTFEHAGYPAWILIYVVIAESVAAVALPLGLHTRRVSLFALPSLIGASQYQFTHHGFWFADGGAELPMLWCAGLIVLALLGDGAYALTRRPG